MAILRSKTVDEVIAAFDKAKTDLLTLASELSAKAEDKRAKASRINAEADGHASEAERAKRVADRVSALVA